MEDVDKGSDVDDWDARRSEMLARMPRTFTIVIMIVRFGASLGYLTAMLKADIEWGEVYQDTDGVWKRRVVLTRRILPPGDEQPRGLMLQADVEQPVDPDVMDSLADAILKGGHESEARFYG